MQRFPKRVSKSQRFLILSEHFQGGLSISELSRKYQVHAATIYQWRREQMSREEKSGGLCPKELLSEIEHLKAENSRLKHTVADQALDITTLKQWNEFMKKKVEGRKAEFAKQFIRELSSVIHSKKRFCELIGVHPKSLYKVNKERSRGKMRIKDKDRRVLLDIRSVIKDRPTYGYKRVTALYNRERVGRGLEKHNKKRIYRVMKENGLLLPKTGKSRAIHKGDRKSDDIAFQHPLVF